MKNYRKKLLTKVAFVLLVTFSTMGIGCAKAAKKPQPTPKPQAEQKAEKSKSPVKR